MPERRQEGNIGRIRQERAAAFRKEIFPYFRYVAQSGFGLVASAIAFSLLIGYVKLLRGVPESWPADWVGAACLLLAAFPTPLRTYLMPADSIFLLPMETNIYRHYLRPSIHKAIVKGTVRTAAMFAVYAPVYAAAPVTEKAADSRSLGLLAVMFAALGAWNAIAGWRERTLASSGLRLAVRSGRFAITAGAVFGLLLGPIVPAVIFAIAGAALCSACWRLGASHYVPWDRLIQEESAARRRWFRFLAWFVDVPEAPSRPVRRPWAAWVGKLVAWERRKAWTYLYTLTYIRGETFGAFYRLCLMAAFVLVAAQGIVVDTVILAVAVLAGGMQLSELGRLRAGENAFVAPLPQEGKASAAAFVGRVAGLAAAVFLSIAAFLPSAAENPLLAIVTVAACLGWMGWRVPRTISKRARNEDEED
ncbi:ABC transporter permease [Cohnella faecalis]|uniref:ABC transporter permease n=1 Tax=Cohnella faecalis TaxID=2315694 RepID=UPI001314DA46|nr:ABC transporter permease [Cohnella faecalis]